MGKIWKICAIGLGASGAVIPPVFGQGDETGPVEITFGLTQRFETDSNLGLTPGGEDDTTQSVTSLSFGLNSVTGIDTLSFDLSTSLRFVNGPGRSGTETEFDDLDARLSFARDVGHSALSVAARYNETEVEFTRPLIGIFDDTTGEVIIPDDLDDLEGTGSRISYGLDTKLELMRDAPVSLTFDASISALDYENVTSANLFDTTRTALGVSAGFAFSPVLDGTLSYRYSMFDAENAGLTERTTEAINGGLTYTLSDTVTLTGSLGYNRTQTDEGLGIARTTQTNEGFTIGTGLTFARPNGNITVNLGSDIDQTGRRDSFDIGRTLTLPQGDLAFSVGLTRDDNGETDTTASLNWSQPLPNGNLTLRLQRGVTVNNDDANRITSVLSASYSHTINSLSSVNFNGSYSASEDTGGGNLVERANLSAVYSHSVTQDWNLNTGYTYRMRNAATTSSADSHSVFLSLSRDFSIRP